MRLFKARTNLKDMTARIVNMTENRLIKVHRGASADWMTSVRGGGRKREQICKRG